MEGIKGQMSCMRRVGMNIEVQSASRLALKVTKNITATKNACDVIRPKGKSPIGMVY